MKAHNIMVLAGLNGFAATTVAAMGAHMLPITDQDMALFETAYIFHFFHTLALMACAALVKWNPCTEGRPCWGSRAANFFLVGILCFSLSLYWRAAMGPGSLGSYHWITPLGGLAFMGGWLTFIVAGYRLKTAD